MPGTNKDEIIETRRTRKDGSIQQSVERARLSKEVDSFAFKLKRFLRR